MNRANAGLLLLASPHFMNTKTIQAGRHFLRSTRVLVMARQVVIFILGDLLAFHAVGAAELELTSPRDFQVVQRATPTKGAIRIAERWFGLDNHSLLPLLNGSSRLSFETL